MIQILNKFGKHKTLVCIFIFFSSLQLAYSQYLGGDTNPLPNSTSSYSFFNGNVYTLANWQITGGTLVSSSVFGNEYEAIVQWGAAGSGSVIFKNRRTILETLNVTIGSGLAVPDMPTITNNCNSTRLTRGTPPSGEVWYWQNSSSGTSTSNSAVYVDMTSGTLYYLKSYKSSISQWSAARTINYTVTQDACGLSNENYIHTVTPNIETTDVSSLSDGQKVESVTYFDGLGRPMQSIGIRAGGNSEDIITHVNYDSYGRSDKDYLPYPRNSTGGSYESDALNITNSFYINNFGSEISPTTPNPYSEKHFEASPLNRILEQGAPGTSWKIDKNSDSDHTIKFDFDANTLTEVKKYNVSLVLTGDIYVPTLSMSGSYTEGELYKTITKDENWQMTDGTNKTTEEFKDKQGRVLLKRTYNNGALDTYYIYDDFGNLTYVLPPKSEPHTAVPDATELTELCYQYKYDKRNRLVEKKIPGKGWEYIVYNKLDQPIMTQDQILKSQNKWLFTKYDVFGRVAYTGLFGSASSRATLQTAANGISTPYVIKSTGSTTIAGSTIYYNNGSYPVVASNDELHTINYYDNYTFDKVSGNSETAYGITPITNARGLVTGSKVRVLNSSPVKWITNVTYYDNKSRPIYIYSLNDYLGTTDKVKNKLDFIGTMDESTATHAKTGKSTITTIDTFTYDNAGRLVSQKQKINSLPEELIVLNNYDELGQLENKKVGGAVANPIENSSGLQTVNFIYNIRGWLKNINQDSNYDNDLFNFTIMYNDIADTNKQLFNGNISQTSWNTLNTDSSTKSYTYTYDPLNRITSAVDNTTNYNLNSVTYDKMGNILSLSRNGWQNTTTFTNKDNLVYTYQNGGNKLQKVLDNGNDNYGFKDGVNLATEYTYDANANLITDANKGITSILYNHLNLPTEIKFDNSSTKKINYTYDADGIKLRKVVNDGGVITTLDYAGNGAVYENNTLQFIPHPEGYITPSGSSWRYVYQYRDHIDNIRLSYSDADGNGTIAQSEIIQENNYYPFGLKHKGYNSNVSSNGNSTAQKFKFNGKELEESLGLNLYEMDFRQYDPALGRFNAIDPVSEERNWLTPYNFVQNNPVVRIDPTGLLDDTFGVDDKGNVTKIDDKKYYDENGKEIDRLYKVDGDGNKADTNNDNEVSEDDSVAVDTGVLDNKKTNTVEASNGKEYTFDQFKVIGDDKGKSLFEFVATNTNVEWSITGVGSKNGSNGSNILTTSHIENSDIGGGYLLARDYTIRFSNHSHPYGNNASRADRGFAKSLNAKFPNARTRILHEGSYTLYDQRGSIRPIQVNTAPIVQFKPFKN